ncbi:MAG: BlaI/MecI/CopY family transcriptional regulator [Clostridia bacterium]|nr:BlaI/MecI/CopY family transcriptional regulator [Clostridia bacterium]
MKNISESELEVMQAIWKLGETTSIEIVKEVSKKKGWEKNTIMTLVSRLVSKKFIEAKKRKGELILYKPLVKEDSYKVKETENFLERMYEGSINDMLAGFAKSKKITKKDLEDLMKLIED